MVGFMLEISGMDVGAAPALLFFSWFNLLFSQG